MNRFFVVASVDMPKPRSPMGNWHMIDLGSHGVSGSGYYLVCLRDGNIQPPATWTAFPRLTDHTTPIKASINASLLSNIGLTGNETAANAVDLLNQINPMFSHA